MSSFRKAVCALALAAFGANAYAAITTYNSRAAFNAATGGAATVETFNYIDEINGPHSIGIGNQPLRSTDGLGATLGGTGIKPGVTYFTRVEGMLSFIINTDGGAGFENGFLANLDGSNNPLTVDFASPVRFFGFDTNNIVGGMSLTIDTISDSFVEPINPANSIAMSFFGFASDTNDIIGLTLGGTGGVSFAIDNFTFLVDTGNNGGNGGNRIPEPGALALMALALGGLGWSRRKAAR